MRIRIKHYSIILFLELLLVMQIPFLNHIAYLATVINAFRIFALFCEIGLLFYEIIDHRFTDRKGTFTWTSLLLIIFSIVQWGVTLHTQSMAITGNTNYLASVVLLVLFTNRGITRHREDFLAGIQSFLITIIAVNLVSILLFPGGLYQEYTGSGHLHDYFFLGIDNQLGRYLFPGFAIVWFVDEFLRNSIRRSVVCLIMVFATYLLTLSGAGIVVSLLMAFFFILYRNNLLNKMISMKIFILILVLVTIGLLLGSNLLTSNSFISSILSTLTGKNTTTFSGRTLIWPLGISMFLRNPIWGYGRGVEIAFSSTDTFSAHNIFLQLLIESGIVGISVFVLTVLSAAMVADTIVKNEKMVRVLYAGIFSSFLYFSMEVGSMIVLYLALLILAMFSKQIILENKNSSRKM